MIMLHVYMPYQLKVFTPFAYGKTSSLPSSSATNLPQWDKFLDLVSHERNRTRRERGIDLWIGRDKKRGKLVNNLRRYTVRCTTLILINVQIISSVLICPCVFNNFKRISTSEFFPLKKQTKKKNPSVVRWDLCEVLVLGSDYIIFTVLLYNIY